MSTKVDPTREPINLHKYNSYLTHLQVDYTVATSTTYTYIYLNTSIIKGYAVSHGMISYPNTISAWGSAIAMTAVVKVMMKDENSLRVNGAVTTVSIAPSTPLEHSDSMSRECKAEVTDPSNDLEPIDDSDSISEIFNSYCHTAKHSIY